MPETATASIPSNGSSRKRSRGPWMSAQPRASFFFMPWLYSPTSLPASAASSSAASSSSARRAASRALEPVELPVDAELLRAREPLEEREAVRARRRSGASRERSAREVHAEDARSPGASARAAR